MPPAAIVTLAITGVLIAAVAFYLIWIALALRHVNNTLGKVVFGVRAIAHRTGPLNDCLGNINTNLYAVGDALEGLLGRLAPDEPAAKVS